MTAGEGPDRLQTPAASGPRPVRHAPSGWAELADWTGGRLKLAGRGLLLCGLALAGFVILLAVLTILGLSVAFAIKATQPYQRQTERLIEAILVFVLWVGLGPLFLLSFRPVARLTRKLSGRWCGVPIASPYLPRPWAQSGRAGLPRRLAWLLTDQATWRDLLYARELLASGTGGIGYLLKDRVFDSAQFVDAVRRVASGGTAMDPEVIARLLARNTGDTHLDALSPREREVLALMAEGRSNAAIAARLVITERAVAKHTASIFLKLDLQPSDDDNRRVLAVLAYLGG